jgi:hypothetical protein
VKIIQINADTIDTFKRSWPCNGIPSKADIIVVAFADNGDLVDYEASDADDKPIDLMNDDSVDGRALSALFDDALANYTTIHDGSGLIGPILHY